MGDEAQVVGVHFEADRHRAVVAQADLGHRTDAKAGDAHRLPLGDVLRAVGDEAVAHRLAQQALADEDRHHQRDRRQHGDDQEAPRHPLHGAGVGVVSGQE
jgi:hypothetical protein